MEIIPAILTNDPEELKEKISQIEGLVKRVQIDIVDGVFVDNKTIGLEALKNLETEILVDIHLMVKEPVDWIEKCTRIKSVDRIIGHVEMMGDEDEFITKVRAAGRKAGLGIDLNTQLNYWNDSELLKDIDVVLLMAVKAGFGGQKFDSTVLPRIGDFDCTRIAYKLDYKICVDGGVNMENIKQIAEAGVDEVAVGQALLGEGDLQRNINELQAAADNC